MKVVHLTRTTIADTTGGLEYHVAYLTEGLKKRGHDVDVMRIDPPPVGAADAEAASAPVSWNSKISPRLNGYFDIARMFLYRAGRNLRAGKSVREIDLRQPDIIHQHCYLAAIVMSWLLARKYPVVFTNHTGAYLYMNRWPVTRALQKWLMGGFAAVIAPSRELLPDISNSHYVPNGVDTSVFHPVSDGARAKLKAKWNCENKLIFVCPRRWAPTKGIIYLAQAISQLDPATREKSIFIFAGNETSGYEQYQGSIQAALQKVDTGEIRVLGNLDHTGLAELMNIADVCVIPSLMEATSLACLEAMACGTPVLATATGGLTELVQDGVNGWLVPTRSAEAIARTLEKIAGMTAEQLRPMKEKGVELVRSLYTWERIAAKTEDIYETALKRWRRRKAATGIDLRKGAPAVPQPSLARSSR
jgi:glycosyltransferase involved in cell wall biosynthesis